MEEEKKISHTCRVCLLQCDKDTGCKFLSLFEELNGNLIVNYISSITNIEILEGDGFPDKICPKCLLELQNALSFKKKCEVSDQTLRTRSVWKSDDTAYIKQEDEDYDDSHVLEKTEIELDLSENVPIKNEETEECVTTEKRSKVQCHDCEGWFPSKCKLRVHWKKMHKPKLMCEICKRIFKSYKAYHIHRKKPTMTCKAAAQCHIDGEGKSRVFHCKSCDFKSSRANDLRAHSVTHSGNRPFQCQLCPKTFKQVGQVSDHLEDFHNLYRHEYTCQHCGKHIKGRHKFYSHIRIHKNSGGQCHICNKQFATKSYLTTHMLRHAETKKYACEYCAATFYTSSELINHLKSHEKNCKYSCDKCEYKSTRKDTIKRHRMKHTDTNIPCLVCGLFLDNEQIFKIHEKIHLERPFSCPHCESNFHRKKHLYKHLKKHVNHATKISKNMIVKKEVTIDVKKAET